MPAIDGTKLKAAGAVERQARPSSLQKREVEAPGRLRDGGRLHLEIRVVPLDPGFPDDLGDEDGRLQLGEAAADAHPGPVTEREEDEGVDLLVVGAGLLEPLGSAMKGPTTF